MSANCQMIWNLVQVRCRVCWIWKNIRHNLWPFSTDFEMNVNGIEQKWYFELHLTGFCWWVQQNVLEIMTAPPKIILCNKLFYCLLSLNVKYKCFLSVLHIMMTWNLVCMTSRTYWTAKGFIWWDFKAKFLLLL